MINVTEQGRPARKCVEITPSDTVNFTDGACRGIFVGSAGRVAIVPPEGSAVTFWAVAAGTVLPVEAIRVNVTDTTAVSLVALY